MVERFSVKPKEGRIVLRIDSDFEEQVDRLAFKRFEGNRSMLVRTALRELIERAELAQDAPQEPVAA